MPFVLFIIDINIDNLITSFMYHTRAITADAKAYGGSSSALGKAALILWVRVPL